MIVSLLHLVLTIRALVRSIAQRFVLGILGGLVRAALLVGALALAAQRASIFGSCRPVVGEATGKWA